MDWILNKNIVKFCTLKTHTHTLITFTASRHQQNSPFASWFVSCGLRVLSGPFGKHQAGCRVPFGHPAIQVWLLWRRLSFWRFHRGTLDKPAIELLVTSLTEVFLPRSLMDSQLWESCWVWTSSTHRWWGSLRSMGPSKRQNCICILPPDFYLLVWCSGVHCQPSDPHARSQIPSQIMCN